MQRCGSAGRFAWRNDKMVVSVLHSMVFRQALSGATYCAVAPLFQKARPRPNHFGLSRPSWKMLSPRAGRLSFAAVAAGYLFIGNCLDRHDPIALFGGQHSRHRQHTSLSSPPAEAKAISSKFASRQAEDAPTVHKPVLED
jgi:hypothetical protein